MGAPRTLFLTVIAIPAILSTASFLVLFYAVWVEQFTFRLYNKLYIQKYSGRSSWMTALPCIASGRLLGVAVGLCGGWAVGALRRRRKEAKDEEKNEK